MSINPKQCRKLKLNPEGCQFIREIWIKIYCKAQRRKKLRAAKIQAPSLHPPVFGQHVCSKPRNNILNVYMN